MWYLQLGAFLFNTVAENLSRLLLIGIYFKSPAGILSDDVIKSTLLSPVLITDTDGWR